MARERAASIKMNVLPGILYLLQAIPIEPPSNFFQKLRKLFSTFIWTGEQPRISLDRLMTPKDRGRISLPSIRKYYLACQLQRISDWCVHDSSKAWVAVLQSQMQCPLESLTWLPPDPTTHHLRDIPLIYPTLQALRKPVSQQKFLPCGAP